MFINAVCAGLVTFSTAVAVPTASSAQGDALKKLAIGLGTILIINEASKGQKEAPSSSGGQKAVVNNQAAQTQQYLNDLGYSAGPVDGRPGQLTRAAIEQFQRDRRYEITGQLTAPQMAALRANRQVVVTPAGPGEIQRESTREAQVYLNQLGFNSGSPDGLWGPRSQGALNRFRVSRGQQQNSSPLSQADLELLHLQVHGSALRIVTAGPLQGRSGDGFSETPQNFGSSDAVAANFKSLEPSAYRHIGTRVDGSQGLPRDLAIQMLKARPSLLDVDDNLVNWFDWENPHISPTELRTKFRNSNNLDQQEIMRKFKADLVQEAADTPAVSEENPLLVAIYNSVPYGFGDYVEGRGLPFASGSASGSSFKNEFGLLRLRQRLVVNSETPTGEYADLSREQASALLDNIEDSKKALYRVAWGRFTNIGEDKSVASFAEADGVYDEVQIASTFIVDRLTLSLGTYTGPGVWEDSAPVVIFDYPTQDISEPNADGQSAIEFLQASGLPMKNGQVLTFPGQQNRRTMAEILPQQTRVDVAVVENLLFRIWLQQNPGFVAEGQNFIMAANKLMTDAEKRQFFGDATKDLLLLNGEQSVSDATIYMGAKFFPNEFAEADAKDAFLTDIYPRKMSEIENWDLPVMQVVGATLLRYETDGGYFPILYDEAITARPIPFRVAQLSARDARGRGTIFYSADRLNTLPDRLEMPRDEARELRERMNGSDRVYLAWTAVLNMTEDGMGVESALGPAATYRGFEPSPGRASIGQIGLFMDPGLDTVLKEFDPTVLDILPKSGLQNQTTVAKPAAQDGGAPIATAIPIKMDVVVAKPEVLAAAAPQAVEPVEAPKQGIWPVVDDLDVTAPIRDMVGLRIGDPVSGVDHVVARDFDVTQIFQTEAPVGTSLSAFEYNRVFVIEGGKQVISVMSYGPDGPILGISRHLYRSGEPWPDRAIAQRLVTKYGEPSSRTFEDRTMVWTNSGACAGLPLSPLGARQFKSVGSGIPNGELDQYLASQALGGLAVLATGTEAFVNDNADCGEVFWYASQPLAPVGGHYGFFTFMTNMEFVREVLEATTPKQEELGIKF